MQIRLFNIPITDTGELLNEAFIQKTLALTLKPFCLNAANKGLPFLGYFLYPEKTLLNNSSKKRFKNKFKNYSCKLATGLWNQKEFQNHVLPLIAFAKYADTYGLRKNCIKMMETG